MLFCCLWRQPEPDWRFLDLTHDLNCSHVCKLAFCKFFALTWHQEVFASQATVLFDWNLHLSALYLTINRCVVLYGWCKAIKFHVASLGVNLFNLSSLLKQGLWTFTHFVFRICLWVFVAPLHNSCFDLGLVSFFTRQFFCSLLTGRDFERCQGGLFVLDITHPAFKAVAKLRLSFLLDHQLIFIPLKLIEKWTNENKWHFNTKIT